MGDGFEMFGPEAAPVVTPVIDFLPFTDGSDKRLVGIRCANSPVDAWP